MKECDKSSGILEEFKLFVADCSACLFLNKEHQEATLLDGRLFLLQFDSAPHVVLKTNFRLMISSCK